SPALDVHSVKWSFGDGTYSDNLNPTHEFPNSGLYNVCLLVRRDIACAADTCINVQVQTPPSVCNLVAAFSWSDSLQNNAIQFTNLSTPFEPTDTIRWNFGDGTPVSYDVNPKHIYTTPGTYNV